ncbi:MAG: M48 family metallopeptidase [Betaproteobacteria bacterium]|nr:M48 family metallopeptidase [Betaproteobacteria bacterium]
MPKPSVSPRKNRQQAQYRRVRLAAWAMVGLLGLSGCAATPSTASGPTDSVPVKPTSEVRRLIPAAQIERSAAQQFDAIKKQAAQKNALLPDTDPEVIRLRAIANRLKPHAYAWNPDARRWQWEVIVLRSDQVNAFCMPGGKIAFFTGILNRLSLSDEEVAAIMGHEMAHALREHARAQMAKAQLTDIGASVLSEVLGFGQAGRQVLGYGGQLLSLKFSRDDETDADLVGLDLAARAGYDPRAAISLWRKMQSQSRGAPPQWLSTHPSGNSRIDEISRVLPRVLPLYAQAIGTSLEALPEYSPR